MGTSLSCVVIAGQLRSQLPVVGLVPGAQREEVERQPVQLYIQLCKGLHFTLKRALAEDATALMGMSVFIGRLKCHATVSPVISCSGRPMGALLAITDRGASVFQSGEGAEERSPNCQMIVGGK